MTITHPEIVDTLTLAAGSHATYDDGACLLEAVSYVAGEPWSDYPQCVCPVLAAFGRTWNDALPDGDRDRLLKPFIARLVGTRTTPDVQDKRACMAADWAVRVFAASWLRKAGLGADADALASLPELGSVESCEAAMPVIAKARASAAAAWNVASAAAWVVAGEAAGEAAWDAAGEAASAAAGEAAGEAAWEAAGEAAWDAASAAASAAAGEAAGEAAWEAASEAASAAARDALADTVTELQASAADLYSRMIDCTP